jgi:hypothetical protein
MSTADHILGAMAEIGALRKLLVHAVALRLSEEPAPLQTLEILGHQLTATPTLPAPGSGLDPAMSDLLADLTDQRTASLVADLRALLGRIHA